MVTAKFKNKYRIASTRLQNWDYSWNAAYFITICTKNRVHYFGEIKNRTMHLSNQGILADVFWHEIKNHAENVQLDAFVVMPNHIHGILILDGNDRGHNGGDGDGDGRDKACLVSTVSNSHTVSNPHTVSNSDEIILNHDPITIGQKRFQNQGKNTLSSIVGSYKSAVTKHANRLNLQSAWQSRFDDRIIRDAGSLERIRKYIITNPANWNEDKFYN